jgi:formylglycine-generating enzyme
MKNTTVFMVLAIAGGSCAKEHSEEPRMKMDWVTINSDLTFQMGNTFGTGIDSLLPAHTVTLTPFQIGKYEVSNRQYCQFLNEAQDSGKVMYSEINYTYKGGIIKGAGSIEGDTLYLHIGNLHWYYLFEYVDGKFHVKEGYENLPVTVVTWAGADAFARFYGWHLPTEAQWERAARGPDPGRIYPWGNYEPNCLLANYGLWDKNTIIKCADTTMEVNTCDKGKSAEGCHHMAGNVYEYCNDYWDRDYYRHSPELDPRGPATGNMRITRGGSLYDGPEALRTMNRFTMNMGDRHSNIGFRVARDM